MIKYDIGQFLSRSSDKGWEESPLYFALDDRNDKALPYPHPEGPWIAGGSLRRLVIGQDPLEADVDYFFKDQAQYDEWVKEMRALPDVRETGKTDHAISFEAVVTASTSLSRGKDLDGSENDAEFEVQPKIVVVKVQGIHLQYYANIEAVLDSFDFTITQLGYDGQNLVVGDHTLWDLARRRLALHRLTHGVSTVRRLLKYSSQGFTACAGCITQILNAVAQNPQTIQSNVLYLD
jgi:hypothetical protein